MMSSDAPFTLDTPATEDVVLEVRTGKMRRFEGIDVMTGIFKTCHDDAVIVNNMGIDGDEHDYTFHGGIDKAVHAYCSAHYPTWQSEHPEAAPLFVPGAFGENLVLAHMNERNVCIGDVVSVGPNVLLQVSLPRQPCFKLNHRFRLKNFGPRTWRHSRTGWYYRVLRGGAMRAGDVATLVERRHPKWTIERVQEFLHRNTGDDAANTELAAIEEMGAEARDAFKGRVAKAQSRAKRAALAADEAKQWRDFRLAEKRMQTPRIASFVFEAVDPVEDAKLKPGAHVKLRLGNGLTRAYSVVGGDMNRFELGVALADQSRGGSRYLHESLLTGDVVTVGRFTTGIPAQGWASNHVFVAGGVGVTAFLPMLEKMRRINYSVTLHYAVRSADEVPFRERLDALGDSVVLYDKSKGQRVDIGAVVKGVPWNTQLYFCGPSGMMDEALRETRAAGLDEKEVHFEAFAADTTGDPFEVSVKGREGTLLVEGEETLLEVLKRKFGTDEVPSSCETGSCGTCKIAVIDGRVEHRGTALGEDEKAGSMLACVSRGIGKIVVDF